eukprot:4865538-Pyramimonas_sp.AAC.1
MRGSRKAGRGGRGGGRGPRTAVPFFILIPVPHPPSSPSAPAPQRGVVGRRWRRPSDLEVEEGGGGS